MNEVYQVLLSMGLRRVGDERFHKGSDLGKSAGIK